MNRYLINVDEDFIKIFIRIHKNVNRICGCDLEPEISNTMEKIIQDLHEGTVANTDMNELNTAMQDVFPNGMRGMIDYDSLKRMGAKLSEAISAYDDQEELPHQLSKTDFNPVFIGEFINSDLFKDSVNIAYMMTRKEFDQVGDGANELGSGLCNIAELEDDVNECINSPVSFHEKFSGWSLKKKILYCKINQILCFLCACFIQPYIQENMGFPVVSHKVSNVKKMPEAGSDVLFKLTENTEAIILENSISYYRIAFIDGDGIKREGYVAKKNVKLINA